MAENTELQQKLAENTTLLKNTIYQTLQARIANHQLSKKDKQLALSELEKRQKILESLSTLSQADSGFSTDFIQAVQGAVTFLNEDPSYVPEFIKVFALVKKIEPILKQKQRLDTLISIYREEKTDYSFQEQQTEMDSVLKKVMDSISKKLNDVLTKTIIDQQKIYDAQVESAKIELEQSLSNL